MFTYNLKEIEKKDIAVYGPSRVLKIVCGLFAFFILREGRQDLRFQLKKKRAAFIIWGVRKGTGAGNASPKSIDFLRHQKGET